MEEKDKRKESKRLWIQRKRMNDEYRSSEKSKEVNAKRVKRKDIEARTIEQEKDKVAHRTRREDTEARVSEQEKNTLAHRTRREDEEARAIEQEKDKLAHRTRREDEEARVKEQEKDKLAHRTRREDEEARVKEQEKDKLAHRTRREDEEARVKEQEKDKLAHRTRREDEEARVKEQEKDKLAHRTRREDEEARVKEQEKNTLAHRMKRMDICEMALYDHYLATIKKGPTIVCSACNGLWFDSSISLTSRELLSSKGVSEEILNAVCKDDFPKFPFCHTCYREVIIDKLPVLSEANGNSFVDVPAELQGLTSLEERMVCPRIPFMQIRSLGRDKQYGLRGNVVNVPISVDTSVNVLPRTFDNTYTVQIKLKRMLQHKSHFMFETVRPLVIYNAAKYLVDTPLYKEEQIEISDSWITNHHQASEPFIIMEEDKGVIEDNENQHMDCQQDQWNEIEEPANITSNDTLWQDNNAIAFAPGEGRFPLSILKDKNVEELSFPTIYCGHERQQSSGLSYVKRCKWELRHKDRRCCIIPKIFFMFKKRQHQMISEQISLHLRKTRNTRNITAGQLLNEEFVDNLCKLDEGYKFLKVDRSSPVYWEARKKEVLAMIRQLGIPSMFVTFSAAETRWKELLVILKKTVCNEDITDNEAEHLTYNQRCDLISADPVTCARYFDKRIRELFRVLQHQSGPFRENQITDSYIRVEFQHRGSPHVHCLLWLCNSPLYNKTNPSSNEECIAFIDHYITTDSDALVSNIIELQTHQHSFSCKKFVGDTITCRFSFPQYPMPSTQILEPLSIGQQNEQYKEISAHIHKSLVAIDKEKCDISFDQFLQRIDLDYETYILVIRSTLKNPKVYLKRAVKDIRVNGFNTTILGLHRANMDIQFILDAYSCVQYILNYLNKADRGMSKLLKEAVEEIKAGNYSIRERLKIIGDRYLNASEISAQEAVYHLLSMDLSRSSRSHAFINTGDTNKRNKIVKAEGALKSLDGDSTDIFQTDTLDYYVLRPDNLKDLCLADFVSEFNRSKRKPSKTHQKNDENQNDDEEMEINEIGVVYVLKQNAGYLEKRTKRKVIRYCRISVKVDEINYYREQCQLYVPYSNEETDLINVDIKAKYFNNLDLIKTNSSKYVYNNSDSKDFEDTYRDIEIEEHENNANEDISHEHSVFSIENNAQCSIGQDISNEIPKAVSEKFLTPKYKPDDVYYVLMRSFNVKQRKYCTELLYRMKTSNEPIYNVIIGGAGVGKSCLISAIFQSLLRYLNNIPGAKPDSVKILLCAPTGKASFNIGGMTLHSAFSLPVSQCKTDIKNLSADLRNTISAKLSDLKLLIIDEISMVSITVFEQIDHRLKEIFRSKKPFGGISVICFGDFHQLRPVKDRFVFQVNDHSTYGALFENRLWNLFKAYELTEIMRQKDDKLFAQALNNLAIGECSTEDILLFKSREIKRNNLNPPSDAIRLYKTNADVEAYNNIALSRNRNIEYISVADDIAEGDVSGEVKTYALRTVSEFASTKTYGLPTTLILKEGTLYMVTNNIDIEDGLVNGANGVLRKIESVNERPLKLWIEFFGDTVGQNTRQKHSRAIERCNYGLNWTPIERVSHQIAPMRSQSVRVRRTQFPIVPAEAITIAKSQGQTFDNVVVNFGSRTLRSEVYVACSRARTSSGLFIDGPFFVPRSTPTVELVESEINRLRTSAAMDFSMVFPGDTAIGQTKFVYQNVQSLVKHYLDVRNDNNYMTADVLLFVETWSTREFEFPGFKRVKQSNSETQKHANGCAVYSKVSVNCMFEHSRKDNNTYFECAAMSVNNVAVLLVYCSAKNSIEMVIRDIRLCMERVSTESVIIVGDFNIDILTKCGQNFVNKLASNNLRLMNTCVTTNGNTCIDLVFARNISIDIHPYESYFSYHKALHFLY